MEISTRAILAFACLLATPFPAAAQESGCISVMEVVERVPSLSILARALKDAGLEGSLRDQSATVTLLAPADWAFQSYAEDLGKSVEDLLQDRSQMSNLLKHHIIPWKVALHHWEYGKTVGTWLENTQISLMLGDDGTRWFESPLGHRSHIYIPQVHACASALYIVDAVLKTGSEGQSQAQNGDSGQEQRSNGSQEQAGDWSQGENSEESQVQNGDWSQGQESDGSQGQNGDGSGGDGKWDQQSGGSDQNEGEQGGNGDGNGGNSEGEGNFDQQGSGGDQEGDGSQEQDNEGQPGSANADQNYDVSLQKPGRKLLTH